MPPKVHNSSETDSKDLYVEQLASDILKWMKYHIKNTQDLLLEMIKEFQENAERN